MKTQYSNNNHYRLSDFLAVIGAWVFAIALVYLVIIKTSFFVHPHIH